MGNVALPGGGYATDEEGLSALVWEAKRRKITYGQLVANTTKQERAEIVGEYCAQKRRKKRRSQGV
jgi:hypothetical protein